MQKLTAKRLKSAELALAAAFFIHGFAAITYIPRIPEIIDQIGVSFASWGLIIGLSGLGSLIPLLITNRLIGRFGTRPIIQISSVMIGLTLMTLAWAPNGYVFFVYQALLAFSMSFFNIAVNAQSVILQKRLEKFVLGRLHAVWSIGAASSAAVSGILAGFMSLQLHLFIVPLICMVGLVVAASFMLSPDEDGHHEEKQRSSGLSLFKSPPQLWLLSFGYFAGVFPELVMMDWSAVFSQSVLSLGPTLGALPYTVFTFAMIMGRLSITQLTKKFDISQISKLGGIIGSIAMLIGLLLGPILISQNEILGVVLVSIFWGISGFGLGPLVPSFFGAAGHVRGLSTAQALSRMSLVNSLVVIFAKILMGALAGGVGLEIAFLFPISMMFIAGILAGQLAKQTKRKEAMENAFPLTGPLTVIDEL
jgi:predicted MFS family arabinose efflux permease